MKDEISFTEIEDVMNRFRRLYKTLYDLFNQKTKDFIMTPQQFQLLNIVRQHTGINQRELAEKLKITPATLSVRIKRMENAGFLIRQIDKDDKRNFVLTLTVQGEKLLDMSFEHMRKNVAMMFAGLSSEELDVLRSCLDRIQYNLDRKKEDIHVKD